MTTGLIICISAVYIFSFFMTYNWVRVAYSKNGIEESNQVGLEAVVVTIFPLLNTCFFIVGWVLFYPQKNYSNNKLTRFFNIKK